MSNLYYITDESGKRVLFRPNEAQQQFSKEMWYFNDLLKSRQLGFCLDPDTKVLKSDLTWCRIADMSPGDRIVSVDEEASYRKTRRMRTGTVLGAVEVHRKAYRITLEDGRSVVCTDQHPWLSRPPGSKTSIFWRCLRGNPETKRRKLKVGHQIRYVTQPWDPGDYEDGWFGGMLDGEGSISLPSKSGVSVTCCQREGEVLDRMHRYLKSRGYNYRVDVDERTAGDSSKLGNLPIHKLVVSRLDEAIRLIGQSRPSRFIGNEFWNDKSLPGKKTGIGWATVTDIEELGEQTMIDLQTSTGTYIAEGLVSHNTTFIQVWMLDKALFNRGLRCGVIAHTKDDAQVFFRDRIRYGYNNLPEWVRPFVPKPIKNDAGELLLDNNSSIRVGTSMRSSTLSILHVSEYGKICKKYPEKAREVRTGALPALHEGSFLFVESTAEGREGDFYERCIRAHNRLSTVDRRPLGKRESKFHFFPWHQDKRYRTDPKSVLIPERLQKYFAELKFKHNIELDARQMAWYAQTEEVQGGDMKREYPSTWEEAFEVSIEGAYYQTQMLWLRKNGRICEVPWEPSLEVNTFWDLGMDDDMTIWFHQRVGKTNRLIDYYENSGEGFDHYSRILKEKGYHYGTHYIPHDSAVRELGTEGGRDRRTSMHQLGIRPTKKVSRPKNLDQKLQQIEIVRQFLPTCWIDEETCTVGINHLENYRKEWNEKLGCWRESPLHNAASHGADSLRTGAVGYRDRHQYSSSDLLPEAVPDY